LRLAPSLFFSIINFYHTRFGKREGMPFFHFPFNCLIKREKMSGKRSKGFTITELVITMAIIGILSAIIIPMYTNHIRRARRSDAKVALEDVRAMEEQFRAENGNYTTDPNNLVSFGWPNDGAGGADVYEPGDYAITLAGDPSTFTARATPRLGTRQDRTDGGQAQGWVEIDDNGTKTSGGGPSGTEDLWK
jgi:type IV pilus assembly protein PilE